MTPSARRPPAPGEKNGTGILHGRPTGHRAKCTRPGFPDVRNAGGAQLHFVDRRQVQMYRIGTPESRNAAPLRDRPHNSNCRSTVRSPRADSVDRSAIRADQRPHRRRGNTLRSTAPACMNCRNYARRRISEQYGHAVGGSYAHQHTGCPSRSTRRLATDRCRTRRL